MRSARSRYLLGTMLAAALLTGAVVSRGQLLPAGTLHNPATGTTPYFSTTLPTWFTGGNIVQTLANQAYYGSSLPGTIAGAVTTTVYKDSVTGQLGFDYYFTMTGSDFLSTVQFIDNSWHNPSLSITGAGADGTGSSQGVGSPSWTDGNPYDIRRDITGNMIFDFNGSGDGTYLIAGDDSAHIFYTAAAGTMITAGTIRLQDTGNFAFGSVLEAAVPEPSVVILWGIGGLVAWAYRPRRQTA